MRTLRRTGVTVLTAGIALAIGVTPAVLVAGGATTGDGGTTTLAPAAAPAPNTLRLTTTSESGVAAFSTKTQEFTGGQFCELTSSPGTQSQLVEISGVVGPEVDATDLAGFRGGQIGVFEQSNASQCFRVDAGSFTDNEVLGLKLGKDVKDYFGPMLAKGASLDLEMRTKTVEILATTYRGDKPTGTFPFNTPRNNKIGSHLTFEFANPALFDRVELKAVSGSFSLEGGLHSGKPTTFDLVSLVDATFCDPGTVAAETVPGAVNTLTKDNTTVTYIGNVTGSASCFGVRLTSGADDVQFLKPLDVARDAQFIFDIQWTLDAAGNWTPDVALPEAFIDFELRFDKDGKVIDTPRKMPFCDSRLFDADGNLVGVADESVPMWLRDLDMEKDGIPGDEGTQYACIGSRNVSAVSANTVTDQIYLIGDARMRL
jgi:hypothetical protein